MVYDNVGHHWMKVLGLGVIPFHTISYPGFKGEVKSKPRFPMILPICAMI